MTSATITASTDVPNAAVQFDTSSLAGSGRYVVEVLENFWWTQITPKGERHTSIAAAVAAAQALVDPRAFDPAVEQLHTAVRIVRVGRFTNVRIEVTPEVTVLPLFLQVLVDGGSPDLSPATGPDPIPAGETDWIVASYLRDAFSPSVLVDMANRWIDGGHAHIARICRGRDGALTVWEKSGPDA